MTEKKIFSIKELAPVIKQLVSEDKQVKFTITGNSMFPLLVNRRDMVTLASFDNIKKYDVVLHQRKDGTYILHRVIGVKGDTFTIAGDNETIKEKDVNISQIIAVAVSFERKGKKIYANDIAYRIYSILWLLVFPLRHFILNILIYIRRLFCGKK